MIAPLRSDDLVGMVSGGTRALDALVARMGAGDSDVALDLFQVADPRIAEALDAGVDAGRRVDVLADARLGIGGMSDELEELARRSDGTMVTYGAGDTGRFQHAKGYHFTSATGAESWLTNLAPIPDNANRTELSLVLGGDAAHAAHAVSRATRGGNRAATSAAIDAAAGHGILVNDPLAGRRTLTQGIHEVLGGPRSRDLLVITKGIEHGPSTRLIVEAHEQGRDVRVLVRDIAEDDARRLVDAGVPAWQVSGGLKPRINAFFAGDRGVVSTAFLWGNMVGGPAQATSRDTGVLLAGDGGRSARDAALATVNAMPKHTPLNELVRRGILPEHV